MIYTSRDGDVVDEIAWRHYGTCNAAILRDVFAANPDLAAAGDVLPRGLVVILPTIAQPATVEQGITLWD